MNVGNGGETHQTAGGERPVLTTQQGIPVADDQNSLKVGARGPTLLEDFHFREKIFHFDHERIPERVVHARGYGAHGYFENYGSLADITRADLFQRKGEKTPVFVRFSTVAGSKGSADLARDVRGFAVKFYTKEGNWDLVGNNIPVFFIQDAIKFPDLIHAVKPEPDRGFPQAQTAHDNFWDFISLTPESMHMIMWVMSDRAHPPLVPVHGGLRRPHLPAGQRRGQVDLRQVPLEAEAGAAVGRLERGGEDQRGRPRLPPPRPVGRHRGRRLPRVGAGPPALRRGLRRRSSSSTSSTPTKLIPEEQVPVRPRRPAGARPPRRQLLRRDRAGRLLHPERRPGIDFSNDPLLQGRNFSYLDTQLKRLGGPNFTHIPINAPKCPFAHFQQDGHMAMHNPKGRVNYEPNSWSRAPRARASRPRRASSPTPSRSRAPKVRRPVGDVRRPLQPGPAVLHQPDRRSSRGTSPTP